MYISTAGNVGIGTTSPSTNLEVAGDVKVTGTTSGINIDTAGHASLRLDRASTSYDNNILFNTNGDTKFRIWQDGNADYLYIRDDDNATNMVTFKKGGDVGIGTTSPSRQLHVAGSTFGAMLISGVASDAFSEYSDGTNIWKAGIDYSQNAYRITYNNFNGAGISLDSNGNLTADGDITAFSDARLKENVKTLPNALESVKAMRGVTYNKIGEEKQSIGVIAQEVQAVLPQLVSEHKDEMLSVAYGNITAVLIEAVKELTAKVESLEEQLKNR